MTAEAEDFYVEFVENPNFIEESEITQETAIVENLVEDLEVVILQKKVYASKFNDRSLQYLEKFLNITYLSEAIVYADNWNNKKRSFEKIERVEDGFKYILGSAAVDDEDDFLSLRHAFSLLWLLHKVGRMEFFEVDKGIKDLTHSLGKASKLSYGLQSAEIRQAVEAMK